MTYEGSSSTRRAAWAVDLAQSYLLFGSSIAKPPPLIDDSLSTHSMARHSDGSSEWRGNQPYDFPPESRVHVRRTPADACIYDVATRFSKRRRRSAD